MKPPGRSPARHAQQVKVVAFDCDGVLFDSKEANVRFYDHVLAHVGRPPVRPDQRQYIHMHTVAESLRHLLGEGESLSVAMDYCQRIDFHEFNRYLQCEPGLVEILEWAKHRFHVALATNRTISTRDVLEYFDLDRYFDLVVSAADVEHPKPHPGVMDRILTTFAVSPQEVVYVGDSAVDEQLASATGVRFVAYKNPELDADYHITHFHQLFSILTPPPA
jgi:HAD superfamily hydrolase (TIGR01509 family)